VVLYCQLVHYFPANTNLSLSHWSPFRRSPSIKTSPQPSLHRHRRANKYNSLVTRMTP